MSITRQILRMALMMALLPVSLVEAQITVRGRLAHDLDAQPGQAVTGSIVIENAGAEPQIARIYQTDYFFFADGTNEYAEPGTSERSNASWIRFSPAEAAVPPEGAVTVDYTVMVPDSLSLAGTFWSMMMVEGAPDPGDDPASGENVVGFRQVTRYGVQIATHVSGEESQEVTFDGVELLADEDKTYFQADVVNIGTSMIRPTVYLRIFSDAGEEFGPFDGVQYRIYPGTSVRQRIALEGLTPGSYQALLVVDAGDEAVFGAQYQLSL